MTRYGILSSVDLQISVPKPRNKGGRPRKPPPPTPLEQIIADFKRIIAENGTDRVAANRALYEVLVAKGETTDPLVPNDAAAMIKALARQLIACGREYSQLAWDAAFPPQEANEPAEVSPGPPASRADLG